MRILVLVLFCLLFDIADLLCELLEDVLVVRILDLQLCNKRQRETRGAFTSERPTVPCCFFCDIGCAIVLVLVLGCRRQSAGRLAVTAGGVRDPKAG